MYTIRQAAATSGVPAALLRAWERRYGIVAPTRTPAGYRLYDEAAIATLRRMRRLVDAGWAPSEAARAILAGEIQVDVADEAAATGPDAADGPSIGRDAWIESLVDAAVRLDSAAVSRLLDEAFARGSFETVTDELVMPGLVAIGRAWQDGRLSVAGEHAAASALMRRLGAMFEAAGAAPVEPDVVVGLPPGSRHEAGALAFAVAARRSGLAVLYLGADVPSESWVDALPPGRRVAAVVGVITVRDVATTEAVLAAIAAHRPDVVRIVGGPAAAGVDGPGPDAPIQVPSSLAAAAATVRELVAARTA